MDKEQARFILRSFRPDGTDAGDPDFAGALKLAMENRELGEWLAGERAFDAAFAAALGSVDLPENLRGEILACLAGKRGEFPQAEDANDAAWIGALAMIQPPASLREEVIAAMDRTVMNGSVPANVSRFRRAAIPLAAAAGIALAFLITRPAGPATVARHPAVPIEVVQASLVRTYESPSFDLEEKREDHQALIRHLKGRGLPCPDGLPPGLQNVRAIGCRELVVEGKRGSLVCFLADGNGVVHLVIFRREDVKGDLPPRESPVFAQSGDWSSARWEEGGKVFLVMSNTRGGNVAALF